MRNAVEVHNVSMRFNLAREKVDNLKEYIVRMLKGKVTAIDEFWALKNVSFNIVKGESFGLVGANGSGKSTMLKIVSGILTPTEGSVAVHGSVAPLIELGAGFDMQLTGRENIFLNGAILGFSKREMTAKYDEIVDFSELGEFIEVPVKNYSSGMIARLGFSCATTVRPEILIVDEILSVGDHRFQEKCSKRMEEMMGAGTTVILVSHSEDDVRRICKKAAWIDHGHLMFVGEADKAIDAYNSR